MRTLLLHGYGASGADLAPILPLLGLTGETPDGPLRLEWGGRAWFALGEGLEWSEDEVRRATEPLVARSEGVLLAGFSQGAAMVRAILAVGGRPRAAVLASGFPADGGSLPDLTGLPVLVTHGRRDPVVPFAAGDRLAREFADAGATVTTAFDDAVHTISEAHLRAFAMFVAGLGQNSTPS